MRVIFKTLFGSHLYGTDTAKSDKDYKAIAIPSPDDIILQNAFKTINESTKKNITEKNTNSDVDTEVYSLHQFIKLCDEGQTVALDMLFSDPKLWTVSSLEWDLIVHHRHKLIHKRAAAFVGYCQTQAAKYGIKGSRVNAVKRTIEEISQHYQRLRILRQVSKLSHIWDELKTALEGEEHIEFVELKAPSETDANRTVNAIQIAGKKLQETITIEYALQVLNTINEKYGERAKLAASNSGIDWKAISHALRVCYEAQELLSTGTITFPLKQAEYLKEVKQGIIPYSEIAPILEKELELVKELEKTSNLPESIDNKFWKQFILDTYCNEIRNKYK